MADLYKYTDWINAKEQIDTASTTLDSDGQADITVGDLTNIDEVEDVRCTEDKGYHVHATSISGNVVTVTVYESAGSNAEMASVGASTDVGVVEVLARGW